MSRRPAIDLKEMQKALLDEDMAEEAGHALAQRAPAAPDHARTGAGRPAISRQARGPGRTPQNRAAPPSAGRAGPPSGQPRRYPARSEAFSPRQVIVAQTSVSAAEVRNQRGKEIDIKEVMKADVFASDSPACDNHFEKNRPCPNETYGISDQFMILDTFDKVRSSQPEKGVFKFNFMVQGTTGDQVIGVRDVIDTVIEIQVGGFAMPIIPDVPYNLKAPPPSSPSGRNQLVLVQNNTNPAPPFSPQLLPGQYPASLPAQSPWINNPYSQLPFGNRMTIQLEEAGLQSYSDRKGARHHFEFNVAYPVPVLDGNPNMLSAMPIRGTQWDIYTFTDPLKSIDGLTLVFRNPDIQMKFEPDCYYEVEVDIDAALAPGPFLKFKVDGHNLLMGDRIFITGMKSTIDALDVYVNRPEGHAVAGDPTQPPLAPSTPIPTLDTFWLDPGVSVIDMLPLAPAGSLVLPQIVTVYVAKRRMRIPIRFRRVVDRLTNYIQP
jgi:hypothetical protein